MMCFLLWDDQETEQRPSPDLLNRSDKRESANLKEKTKMKQWTKILVLAGITTLVTAATTPSMAADRHNSRDNCAPVRSSGGYDANYYREVERERQARYDYAVEQANILRQQRYEEAVCKANELRAQRLKEAECKAAELRKERGY